MCVCVCGLIIQPAMPIGTVRKSITSIPRGWHQLGVFSLAIIATAIRLPKWSDVDLASLALSLYIHNGYAVDISRRLQLSMESIGKLIIIFPILLLPLLSEWRMLITEAFDVIRRVYYVPGRLVLLFTIKTSGMINRIPLMCSDTNNFFNKRRIKLLLWFVAKYLSYVRNWKIPCMVETISDDVFIR